MSLPNKKELVAIGRIIKSRGVKGELRVFPLTDRLERFFDLEKVFIEREGLNVEELTIEYVREISGQIAIKFEILDDRTIADSYKGAFISVSRDDTYELEDDSFFLFDIQGLSVYDSEENHLGSIKEVIQYPANDLLLIRSETEDILLPALKQYIHSVNLEEKKIIVTIPEGLPTYPRGSF